ncbi:MAG: ATP-binding protein, partial [Gammaproteobacteria bacterium]
MRQTVDSRLTALRWGVFLCGAVGLLALVPYVHSHKPPDTVTAFERMSFGPGESRHDSTLHPLPDDWYFTHPEVLEGRYSATVPLAREPDDRWAVYLPSVNMNAAVYVNGRAVGDGGQFDDPVARNEHRPLLFPLIEGHLAKGENTIEVRVKANQPGSGYLGRVYLGPESALEPVYELRLLAKVGVVWALTIGLGLLGCFIGALWLARRRETVYGWFALVAFLWTGHNLNILLVDIPMAGWSWDWCTRFGCLHWFAIVGVIFVNRYTGSPQPRCERWLCAQGALFMLVFAVLPEPLFYSLALRVWDPIMIGIGLYAGLRLWLACRRQPSPDVIAMFVAGVVVNAFGVRDVLLRNYLWDREHGLYLHYAAPLVMVVIAWMLLRRFAAALSASETMNSELERRVDRSRCEIERNHERLRAMERDQVLARERERLVRDMHDGVGGHLVSTLALIDSGRANAPDVAQCLREALTDLRLTIDSLDSSASDLATLLGMLRERIQRRLTASGIEVRWYVEALPPLPGFGPRKALHVLRIVQEAITNVLKHSGAGTLTVRANHRVCSGRDAVVVEIGDDGAGIGDRRDMGKGLSNMGYRARAVGAELNITSTAQGTCVRLVLPLDAGGLS